MSLIKRDEQHHTYGDYVHWPEDVRYELIDGIAYLMSPAPDIAHQDLAGGIFRQLGNQLLGKKCRVFIAPVDVRLPKKQESDELIDTVVQPDVLVVCDQSKIDRRGVRGAPDLVVEVLSPSTASHDHVLKRHVYERSGVKEYWLVHPVDRMVTVYRHNGTEFAKPDNQVLEGQTEVNILPGIAIAWDELVALLPPVEY